MPTAKKTTAAAKTPRKPAAKKTAAAKPPAEGAELTKAPARRRKSAAGTGPDLVIVESPAKAKTINKYLGSSFKVLASYGHVRDLPRGRKKAGEEVAGVNIAEGWVPRYEVPKPDKNQGRRKTAQQIISELKKEAAKAGKVYLATDPDREGEAIAWHILDELKLDDDTTYRVTFNEITKSAVTKAIEHPDKIDMDRVKAQEARRILDRVVGYPLSSLLGEKITRGLSAGRVQSVALRLVVDREREIEAFKTEEYWKLTAELAPQGSVPFSAVPFRVQMAKKKGEAAPIADPDAPPAAEEEKATTRAGAFKAELAEWNGAKFASDNEEATRQIAELLDRATWSVSKLEQKDRAEKASPPFTTSTLQQQGSLRLRFTAKRTMDVAQKLYEGVPLGSEGQVALITYMRTDSTRISNEAITAVREHIGRAFGEQYLPAKPNFYASGKSAQEAHEAIRPTDVTMTPQRAAGLGLAGDQLKLYSLIYNRFVACQMSPAVFAVTNVEVLAKSGDSAGTFRAQGKIQKFDGFRRVYQPGGKQEDATLPALSEGGALDRLDLLASQHFTQPPARYNEASLVKALEKEGIGRPSTYAAIIGKITSDKRGYIEVKDRRFYPTEIAKAVTDLLVEHFPQVMDLKFTAHMEEDLDKIAGREMTYTDALNEFWLPFTKALETAREKLGTMRGSETGEKCPECGKPMVVKFSKKTGRSFVGCSGYLEGCKYIKPREGEEAKPAAEASEHACPNCGKPMLKRFSRRGPFLGCSGYPDCKTTMNIAADGTAKLTSKPTDHKCEKCGSPMALREGKRGPFLGCTGYPKCRNIVDVDANGNPVKPVDTGIACEKCQSPMVIKKGPRGPFLACSGYPKCRSYKAMTPELKEKFKDVLPAAAPKKETPVIEVNVPCPECGAAMKLRSGRGNWFLGCSKYPKCKGTREAPPELLEKAGVMAGAVG
ncbi:MAG: type I DNA topoisomerase [Gemmataceae bacterium]|nr:type I DNA topoisomerase [Gemmataceae bacterium]